MADEENDPDFGPRHPDRLSCENCERCTWNRGPDCGVAEHRHCEKCGHCEGRHVPLWYARQQRWTHLIEETPNG